jgi:hypothetical protein
LLGSIASQMERDELAAGPDASGRTQLADWLIQKVDLFAGADAPARRDLKATAARRIAEQSQLASKIPAESHTAPAILDGNAVDEVLLVRGSSKVPGAVVKRRCLEALVGDTPVEAEGSGRLELAKQIASADNPLTARVMVNRIWHHLFGKGIVPSVDNFGVLGQEPSNQALLDQLALEYVQEGWSTKRMIRRLMLSRAYQMSSRPDALQDPLDPDNTLLHRMNIRRLEGEAIRDSMLFVSGRFDPKLFGPSVPVHLTAFMEGRGRPASGPLDGDGRRSIYISIKRNFLSPMMLAFDTPAPFSTMGRRNVSNVPAQALILMNDPFVVEQARLWGQRMQKQPMPAEQRLDAMYRAAFGRPATEVEVAEGLKFLDEQAALYGVAPENRRNAAEAWADLAHVLFNYKEFIYLN